MEGDGVAKQEGKAFLEPIKEFLSRILGAVTELSPAVGLIVISK